VNIDEARDARVLFARLEEFVGALAAAPDYEELARTFVRLDIRAEERSKVARDPYAEEIANDIERTMKSLSLAEKETIRQFVVFGSLTTGAARSKAKAASVDMNKWSVPWHLMRTTGWLTPSPGNTADDMYEQNLFSISPDIRPHLIAYFSKNI
jgi:hypothetical protein